MKTMRVVELFGGIGAFRKALLNQKFPHELIDFVEIDRNCVKSYNVLYNENFIPQSVKGYSLPNVQIDLLMHGSPCQDFSRSGLKRGGRKGSYTRSSLLFETIMILKNAVKKPKWVIWENVVGVLDKKMKPTFETYLSELEYLGYSSCYWVLDSYDFGIPQKRKRVFVVSFLGEVNPFDFSKLERMKSPSMQVFLEKDVAEKYLVTQPSILKYIEKACQSVFTERVHIIQDYCYTISTKQTRVPNAGFIKLTNGKYRYLTERECFRLMGFTDLDFDLLRTVYPEKTNKKSSILYQQAGNSIVVPVLEAIIKQIYQKELIK
ncbi:DNA cytosine methyltransferase [Streptococcus suis]|uniref:DNA cytosine methyltransferase n=1 Tax=Streptococcus suis TaxID=1307 RepID=UPI00191632E0|nr:DNA (cytosine-5-)-methyltransferase [Streptococcus suis]MDW8735418.1 DNA (cytosine-5-)-methyltransferase [Streptococcus suis]WNN04555.1 DNA (cytosine-5-)-methyltransferase [Streptococcus suis]HEM3143607.1 DNA (cytosine-5-)-methyltransferase [Streptococcus suis]HEM3145591.1 DNA (cytosine-5-)-methyltransferase [Streptococcus suis]HEM3405268.1 DNA (cytosine-5-)-methyltransferase [Streptococcus suis]